MAQEKRHFIVDAKGRKRAVVLPLKEYRELLEDLEDLAIIAKRKEEPVEPFERVKEKLEQTVMGGCPPANHENRYVVARGKAPKQSRDNESEIASPSLRSGSQ